MTDRLEPVRQAFDAIAEPFAVAFADELSRKPFDRDRLDAFAAAIRPGGRVLDLGCGPAGQVGRYVADRGVAVTGVDFSSLAIERATAANPGLEFVVADLRSLPFEAGSIDAAVAFYCFIYGTDDDVVDGLADVRRVLRPGGRLLAAVHGGAEDVRMGDYHGIEIDVTVRMTTPGTIAALAERAGLRVDEIQTRDPYEFEFASRRIYITASAPAGD
jgi:SAM-dependent methyltransferase